MQHILYIMQSAETNYIFYANYMNYTKYMNYAIYM